MVDSNLAQLLTVGTFGGLLGALLGFHFGRDAGSARTRRDLDPLIERALQTPRPLSLTITQPPHAPGTVTVTENVATPSVDAASGEPFVLDRSEVERRRMEAAEEFVQRAAAVGIGGFAPGEAPASIIVSSHDPLVQDLVVGPALATE